MCVFRGFVYPPPATETAEAEAKAAASPSPTEKGRSVNLPDREWDEEER